MSLFDLLLLATVLTAAVTLVVALVQFSTRRSRSGIRTLVALCGGVAMYLAAVCTASLTAPPRVLAFGEPACSDDWCFTATGASSSADELTVEFRVWSRARRVRQREFGVAPLIRDEKGRYFPVSRALGPPFDREIGPGEAFTTSRVFLVPSGSGKLYLLTRAEGITPGTFVIGDSQSLLHPRLTFRIR